MNQIRMLVFDIDGVITDGKQYIGKDGEIKTVSMKDLDAIRQIQETGCAVGCISGEDTEFSRRLVRSARLEPAMLGCKNKAAALEDMTRQAGLSLEEVCYIGDGKYDIPALKIAGLALCPADAIEEVKREADMVLRRGGGDGCIAEIHTLLAQRKRRGEAAGEEWQAAILKGMNEHLSVLMELMKAREYAESIKEAAEMIVDCCEKGGRILICGSGGSAACAQHLAGELVGRLYLERRALDAEALAANPSVVTSPASGYDCGMAFVRQIEAKARNGGVLIGITTGGAGEDIRPALAKAKELGLKTVLMTGEIPPGAEDLADADCLIAVPARDAPRVEEMHIMIGHVICELVEREVTDNEG